MRSRLLLVLAVALTLVGAAPRARSPLPPGFVYLSDVAPSIVQNIRYAGYYNFIGRPIDGYLAGTCILTKQAAEALANVQRNLEEVNLTLKVYDCYRPQRAVNEFVAWSKTRDQRMKLAFYPRVDKAQLFKLGYLVTPSSHSRGSTVDVSIERFPPRSPQPYSPGDPLRSCIAPFVERYASGSIDMGSSYDCMDELSHSNADVGNIALAHRLMLRDVMEKCGFEGIETEWWHFVLRHEPFPKTYFDFPIVKKP